MGRGENLTKSNSIKKVRGNSLIKCWTTETVNERSQN